MTTNVAAVAEPQAIVRGAEFAALYRDRYQSMLRLAVLLVDRREAAEDVVQDAFAKVYVGWARLEEPAAYLRTTVVNGCRDVQRRRRVASRLGIGRTEAAEPGGDHVLDALAGLSSRQRTALVLRFYDDLAIDEIARVMRARPGTVKSLIHRGLAQLREVIER